jgi:hypothetical protein
MEKAQLKDRQLNYISVFLNTESGCNAFEGEYSLYLASFMGELDISSVGGVDDISLAKECIENHLDFSKIPKHGTTEIILKESGEWEDVFWHKYYEIERVCILDT